MNENIIPLRNIQHLQVTVKLIVESFYQFISSFGYTGNPCLVVLPWKFDAVHHQTILEKDLSIGSRGSMF